MNPQEEKTVLDVAKMVKYVPVLYKCEVCGTKEIKHFFTTPLTKGFPRKRFCSKECRKKRHGI